MKRIILCVFLVAGVVSAETPDGGEPLCDELFELASGDSVHPRLGGYVTSILARTPYTKLDCVVRAGQWLQVLDRNDIPPAYSGWTVGEEVFNYPGRLPFDEEECKEIEDETKRICFYIKNSALLCPECRIAAIHYLGEHFRLHGESERGGEALIGLIEIGMLSSELATLCIDEIVSESEGARGEYYGLGRCALDGVVRIALRHADQRLPVAAELRRHMGTILPYDEEEKAYVMGLYSLLIGSV